MKLQRRLPTVLPPALLPALLGLTCALGLASGCASTEKAERHDAAWLVRNGQFEEAVRVAAEEAERHPDDQEAQDNHRLASTAWLLERGRRLYFAGRGEEALEVFQQAAALEPDSPPVKKWVVATLQQLGDEWFDRGLAAHNQLDFQTAIDDYEKALSYEPDHELARETLARALLQQNYRAGLSEDYYDQGVRALDRYFLHEADSLFQYVQKYDEENERAEKREGQTKELLAVERAAMAADLEDSGEWAAARNEYRLALLLQPDLEQARQGFERMQVEEEAAEDLRESERQYLKGQYGEAEKKLDAAAAITKRQGEEIEARRGELEEARLERMYETARTLESDWRYEEAVKAYGDLLERSSFYKDAIARRDTLQSYVDDARELYAKYEAAKSDDERLDYLRQIAVFWPEYRDVSRRLSELESAAAPQR